MTLSIDILPGQLRQSDFCHDILGVLADTGLALHRLQLEVAENLIVRDLAAAKAVLSPLHDSGVRVALDHFGTGYSSLYHIGEFKLDKVKIDRRLTQRLGEADAVKMIRALAGLGHGLDLTVSAETDSSPLASMPLLKSGVEEVQSSSELISAADTARLFRSPYKMAAN